jgi:uroporphyrinogen III methyltransferase/synthase
MHETSGLVQVAIIREAGLPDQQMWRAQLGSIVQATAGASSLSPCVTVIGQVAALGAS